MLALKELVVVDPDKPFLELRYSHCGKYFVLDLILNMLKEVLSEIIPVSHIVLHYIIISSCYFSAVQFL